MSAVNGVSARYQTNARKLMVVERDGLLRESLGAALAHSEDPHLVGVFENILSAYKAMPSLSPHVVITDIPSDDNCDELAALLRFAKDFPRVGLVFLLNNEQSLPAQLLECMTSTGPAGRCFLRKQDITTLTALLRVIQTCADGFFVLNPEFFQRSPGARPQHAHSFRHGPANEFRNLFSLRQQEVLDLMAQGLSNRSIADRLFVSERTVENHVYQIYHRLPDALRTPGYHLRVSTTLCYLGFPLPTVRTES